MKSSSFDIFSGWCAVLAGIIGLLYAIAFFIVRQLAPETGALLSAFFLTWLGLLGTVAMTALYSRFRDDAAEFALWAYILGLIASTGTAIHGCFDLADAIHPSSLVAAAASADVPSEIDPRGFLAFFVGGLAILAFSWLIARTRRFPRALGLIGYGSSIFLILLFLARLIIVTPANPIVIGLAIVNGIFLTPIWYIGLGLALWRGVTRIAE